MENIDHENILAIYTMLWNQNNAILFSQLLEEWKNPIKRLSDWLKTENLLFHFSKTINQLVLWGLVNWNYFLNSYAIYSTQAIKVGYSWSHIWL